MSKNIFWLANYFSGAPLCEFDQATGKENSFYEIKKDILSSFHLVVNGNFISFSVQDGVFKIEDKKYPIFYDNELLTAKGMTVFNDIIQYKCAESIFDPAQKNQQSPGRITSWNIGYKAKLKDFNIQCLVSVSAREEKTLTVKLSSPQARKGKLRIGDFTINAPLAKNITGEITIKI
ncbi:MAG: hypothetical protein LBR56_03315 [Sporomusaceae bacterium]|jgi:hypothetical protein|nr:hypothetical protein [Sporomusaceae bacterium]